MKFNLYNSVEYIKDYFWQPNVSDALHPHFQQDARDVALMSHDIFSTDEYCRNRLCYCIIVAPENIAAVKFLLARNGMRAGMRFDIRRMPKYTVLSVDEKDMNEAFLDVLTTVWPVVGRNAQQVQMRASLIKSQIQRGK